MNTEYYNLCSRCECKKYYKNKNSYYVNKNKKCLCKECSNKEKSSKMKGRTRPPFSEEWRKNLSTGHKNSKIWEDSMNTVEYKEKQSISKSGSKNYMYGKHHSDLTREKLSLLKKGNIPSNKGISMTDEQKNKLKQIKNSDKHKAISREHRLKQIKESGGFPSFNKTACKFFDHLNQKMAWNGQHALNNGEREFIGYSLDYYEPKLNLIIEWDEIRHEEPNIKSKDVIRQNNILNEDKSVIFYRINQKMNNVYKVDTTSFDYTTQIQGALNEFKK